MTEVKKPLVATTKNIGELSEPYAIVYILGQTDIPVVDGSLSAIPGAHLRFVEVRRLDKDDKYVSYSIDNTSGKGPSVVYQGPSVNSVGPVNCEDFKQAARELLQLLRDSKNASKIAINNPEVVKALSLLATSRVSAKASDKSDFIATVVSNGMLQTSGFSIKSQLGGQSTLVNSSRDSSYFEYEILRAGGMPLSDANRTEILNTIRNSAKQGFGFVQELLKNGYELRFTATAPNLNYTLRLVDSFGPEIVAQLLLEEVFRRNRGEKRAPTIAELVDNMAERIWNTQDESLLFLGSNKEELEVSIGYKMRSVLLAFMSGATPGARWDGRSRATGGIIVVKKTGEVVCVQLSTQNAVGDYLMNSCRLEAPGSERHDWGYPYAGDNGRLFVRMQLQVRFTA
mgnify:CR=1 FL=1